METEVVALADGDLRWLFPELEDTGEVLDLVRRADRELRVLAGRLGVRPGWVGGGIEFHRLEWGQTSLFGRVEAGDASFEALLWFPRRCAWNTEVGPPWEVWGEISVRCDDAVDCGPHVIEGTRPRQFDSPLDAVRALLEVAIWLRERGTAEPVASWRQRDGRSGHG